MTSWSKTYFPDLKREEHHKANDEWFQNALNLLSDTGILVVPILRKSFNKKGEEIGDDHDGLTAIEHQLRRCDHDL